MATVKLNNVSKKFGKKIVLKNLSIEVQDKELFCLLGPLGAGKTTTFRIIAGLETSDEGSVYIDDERVDDFPPAERDIAMFFETLALYPNKTGYENIAFPLRLRKQPEDEIKQRVSEVTRILKIEHIMDRLPKTYSGGELQRVALARTIVRRPRVFLLDEPLSNIDALLRLEMRVELKRLRREIGQTIIYATPDPIEGLAMGDRVCVLREGEIQQIASPKEIYNVPKNRFVAGFIGSPPINFIDCTLEESKDGRFYLDEGTFRVDVTKLGAAIREQTTSSELTLAVRPEDVKILDSPAHKDDIPAETYVAEHLGSKLIVTLSVGRDKSIKAIGSPDVGYKMGDKKWLEFDGAKMHVIDRKTERVLV